jgi:hypothetical protein
MASCTSHRCYLVFALACTPACVGSEPRLGTDKSTSDCGEAAVRVCSRTAGGLQCALSNGTGFDEPTLWSSSFAETEAWNDIDQCATIQFGDIDGDGNDDVCARDQGGMLCGRSDGAAFSTSSWGIGWRDSSRAEAPDHYSTIQFADVNADGRADVCGRGNGGISCGRSNGLLFFDTYWDTGHMFGNAAGWEAPSRFTTIQLADITGDGASDVCGRSSGGIRCLSATVDAFDPKPWSTQGDPLAFSDAAGWGLIDRYATIQLRDVNGDGKADVCGRGATGVFCGVSDGSSSFHVTQWDTSMSDEAGWSSEALYRTIQFPDVNGDGKADLCARHDEGIVCGLSEGTRFATPAVWAAELGAGWGEPDAYSSIQFPDIDADGKADVCGRAEDGIYCGISDGSGFAVTKWSDAFATPDISPDDPCRGAIYFSTVCRGDRTSASPPTPTLRPIQRFGEELWTAD